MAIGGKPTSEKQANTGLRSHPSCPQELCWRPALTAHAWPGAAKGISPRMMKRMPHMSQSPCGFQEIQTETRHFGGAHLERSPSVVVSCAWPVQTLSHALDMHEDSWLQLAQRQAINSRTCSGQTNGFTSRLLFKPPQKKGRLCSDSFIRWHQGRASPKMARARRLARWFPKRPSQMQIV